MTGRSEQVHASATTRTGVLPGHRSARSVLTAARRVRVSGLYSWLPRVAVVLGWAVVMLLAGAAVAFAVATVLGYSGPDVWSPALPMPRTPEPGLDL